MYENIIDLIQRNELEKALEEIKNIEENKWEKYNLSGLIYFYKNELEKAKTMYEKGLKIEPINSDLLYNYAHILISMGKEIEAWKYLMRIHEKDWAVYDILGDIEFKNRSKASAIKFYKKAYDLNKNEEMAKKLLEKRKAIKKNEKIAFFCLPGLETFIKPIAEELTYEYDVRLIISKEEKEIKEGIEWADIVWIEWANELAIYITNKFNLTDKYVINRLHSYEVFSGYPLKINWGFIDKLIFVSNHIKEMFFEEFNVEIDFDIINNGIDLDKYKFKNRKKGYNLCSVANVNYKKSPDMWIELINKLIQVDIHYNIEVAGDIQDKRYLKYFEYIIKDNHIEKNFVLNGWTEEIEEFLDNKNYLISTSIHESFGYNIGEAMARGIKPIIRNFRGSKEIWPENLIFNTLDEAIEKITEESYDSESYRRFIEDNYTLERQINKIEEIVEDFYKSKSLEKKSEGTNNCLVTIGVTNYNSEKYVKEFLDSVIDQTFKNIELIIVDDHSTDKSVEIIKEYERKYDFIQLIEHEVNKGCPDYGRNEILNAANGEYVLFLDSDDKFTYNYSLEKLVDFIQRREELDYVYTDYTIIDGNSKITNKWESKIFTKEEIIRTVFNRMGSGILPGKGLFKVDFFRRFNIIYPINGTAADTLLSLICLKNNMKYGYLKGDLISYRIHENNFTMNKQKRLDSLIPIIDYILENFRETLFPQASKEAISFELYSYFKRIFYTFELELWKPWGIDYANFHYTSVDYSKLINIIRKYSLIHEKYKEKYEFLADYIVNLNTRKYKPLVSILIPTYNLINFFKQALESALSQTYPNIEILVSDDSTEPAIEEYMQDFLASYKGDKVVKFYKHTNNNDWGIKNHDNLLEKASGEYISFLHHDDLIHKEKVRVMMHFFILEEDVSLVTSYRVLIDKDGKRLEDSVATKRITDGILIEDGQKISRLLFKSTVNFIGEPSTAIFKYQNNQSLSNYHGYTTPVLGDYTQWLNSLENGDFVYIPIALNFTRRHEFQNTHKIDVKLKAREEIFYLLKAFYENKKDLRNEYKQILLLHYNSLKSANFNITLKKPLINTYEKELDKLFLHKCIICGNYFDKFISYKITPSDYVRKLDVIGLDINNFSCPFCGSTDRERHLILFITRLKIGEKLFKDKKILHFAPEKYFKKFIESFNPKECILADLYPTSEEIKRIDVMDISFPAESFDTVIFNHVLEHVLDPKKALSEIKRVLKTKGYLILQTPYSEKLEKTFQSQDIKTEDARTYYYGQSDHLRVFGRGLFELIQEYFELKLIKSKDLFEDEIAKKYGFNNREPLFLCKKV